MATASRELRAIAGKRPSSYIIREAFHESLRDYVCALLGSGQQSAASESLVRAAFEAILQSGSVSDIAWAQSRLARAVAALDDGHYGTVHTHQSNFEKMIQALGIQKSICDATHRAWAR
jgi:hypothetical protein